MSTTDAEEQAEEAASLEAIYGDEVVVWDSGNSALKVYLPSRADEHHTVTLRVLLPPNYPSAAGPVMELEAQHNNSSNSDSNYGSHHSVSAPPIALEQQLAAAVRHMEDMYSPGQVCLFDCIEWLREQLQQWQDEAAAAALANSVDQRLRLSAAGSNGGGCSGSDGAGSSSDEGDEGCWDDVDPELRHLPEASSSQPRQRGDDGDGSEAADSALIEVMRHKIISGEPFTERKSTFQAHVAPITHVDEVKAVVSVLLESNKIRNATHNIMAYRIADPDRPGVFHQDCDDDGEAAAGGRLLHLLQVAGVQNAVVVVSRWFGGILLGPARFGLINNTARQLLEQTGFIQHAASSGSSKQGGGGGGSKKSKKW